MEKNFILAIILSLLGSSCAVKEVSYTKPEPVENISSSYLGFAPSKVCIRRRDESCEAILLKTYESVLRTTAPAASSHFDQAKLYMSVSRKSFWIGLGGLVLSAVADSQGVILGRTTGNAIWAAGWTSWLGFLGLADAEYEDASTLYMERFNEKKLQPNTSFDRGHRPFARSVASWAILEF